MPIAHQAAAHRRLLCLLLVISAPAGWPAAAQARLAPDPTTPPTTAGLRVGLQAGHWKITGLPDDLARLRGDSGAVAAGHTEVATNLDLARRTAGLLTAAGVTVDILPATVPTGYQADAFVAIHADANSSARIHGYKIATRWRSSVTTRDVALVVALDAAYSDGTGLAHDSAVTRNMRGYYAMNTWLGDSGRISDSTPAALIETGYMTSPTDRALLFNQPDRVAAAIAQGILDFVRTGSAVDARQQRTEAVAAASPTGRSVLVISGAVPIRTAGTTTAPIAGWASCGDSLPYLDTIIRPTGPFTKKSLHGTELATNSGYYRIGMSGLTQPLYISRDAVIVQQPEP